MTKGWQEWAKYRLGIQKGCYRGCKYCFGMKEALRFKRIKKHEDWIIVTERKTIENPDKKYNGLIGFPNTHDITLENYSECEEYLLRLLKAGNQVLIVTKPDYHIIELLISALQDYKDQVEFRLTIGSYDDSVLKKFEPRASNYQERYDCLRLLFMNGFKTSVSIEPYLSRDIIGLIRRIYVYVTGDIWIGIMNHFNFLVNYYPELLDLKQLFSKETVQAIYQEIQEYFTSYDGLLERIKFKDTFRKIAGVEKNSS